MVDEDNFWYNITMKKHRLHSRFFSQRGFSLLEAVIASGVFLLFAVGIYGGLNLVFKIVYQSRIKILETAILSEQLEIARNLPFSDVGIVNGAPAGLLIREKTVSRNGLDFDVLTTVRNIDDPFDGLAPEDSAPADYKLVEVAVNCPGCRQSQPVSLSTRIAPKKLEGDSENGSLFIHVFDALGQGVAGASVVGVNTAISPEVRIEDTTDASGWLRLIDIPTGTFAYEITVSKNGYSTDYTISPTDIMSSPVKPPATVIKQTVTELSFAIDRVGQGVIKAVDSACRPVSAARFNLRGDKTVSINPAIYKYNKDITLNSSGVYSIAEWEWDTYVLSSLSTDYDIAGTIPMLPLNLAPGSSEELTAILVPHTNNSILVKVKDAGTGLPLSDAVVTLSNNNTNLTRYTGLGYVRQTDWSGDSGQIFYTDEYSYFATDGNLSLKSPDGEISLFKSGNTYSALGWLESSTFDLGSPVAVRQLIFTPHSPGVDTAVRAQIAIAVSSSPESWVFVGPDGATSTFFSATSSVATSNLNGQYMRYRVYLSSENGSNTPQLSELAVTYTNGCVPPGQVFFSGVAAGEYIVNITRPGYAPANGVVIVDGVSEAVVNMSPL